jgi:hypothetical protein
MPNRPAGSRIPRGTVSNERGAALMIVLVTLVGLTALAAAGMLITETDLRASQNHEASTTAFYAADAGLQEYLGRKFEATETDTFTYLAGSTIVDGTKMLDLPHDRVLYRVRSASSYTPPEGGTASRTVSRLALFSAGSITTQAAFAAGSGLLKTGGAGTISGHDWAPGGDPRCPDSPGDDVAGVAVPDSGYVQTGGVLVPEGEPDLYEAASTLELLQSTGVDWEGLVDGDLIAPDYMIPPDSWPNFATMDADSWPVIFVTGNYEVTPDFSGRGTFIATGNVVMNGSFEWDGLILTGGYLTSNGYQQIEGSIITGLNELLGETVPKSDLGNGNKSFKYHSCYLSLASKAAFGGLAEVPGSWFERWQ